MVSKGTRQSLHVQYHRDPVRPERSSPLGNVIEALGKKPACFLLFIAFIVIFFRIPTFRSSIIDIDEAYFSMRANEMVSGGELYRDIISRKFPFIEYLYFYSFSLFGKSNMLPIHIFTTLWVIGTCVLIFFFTRRFFDYRSALWATVIYAVFSHAFLAKDILDSNREIYMILPLIVGSAFFLQGGGKNVFISGCFFSAAFLFKQTAGIQLLPCLLCILLWKKSFREKTISVVLLTSGFLVPLVFIAVLYLGKGMLGEMIYWCFTANYYYIFQSSSALYVFQRFVIINASIIGSGFILWFFGFRGSIFEIRRYFSLRKVSPGLFCSLWFFASTIPVVLGFRFFPHYYIQLFPPLAILAGPQFARWILQPLAQKRANLFGPLLTIGFTLAPFSFWILGFFPRAIPPEPQYNSVGDYLIQHSQPDNRIFVWGNFAEIYWYTKRNSATRFYNAGFITGISGGRPPDTGDAQIPEAEKILMDDFSRHPPAFIVDIAPAHIRDQQYFPISEVPRLHRYLHECFQLAIVIDDIHIYRRNEKKCD